MLLSRRTAPSLRFLLATSLALGGLSLLSTCGYGRNDEELESEEGGDNTAAQLVSLTIKPKAGTLGTDDLCLHACWLEYTRKLMTS